MTKGKPWTIDQETELRKLVEANTPIDLIATKLGKNPPDKKSCEPTPLLTTQQKNQQPLNTKHNPKHKQNQKVVQ